MLDSERTNIGFDNLVQKLDDISEELEIQTDYLGKIKTLLTVVVILMIPVVLFIGYILYQLLFPDYLF